MPWLVALLVVGTLVAWLVLGRANELFVLVVEDGRTVRARGALPAELERELGALLAEAGATGRLRGVREGGQTRLIGEGLDEDLEQRLRNVFFASRHAKRLHLGARPRPALAPRREPGPFAPKRKVPSHLRVVEEDEPPQDGNSPLP